jgi:hypothetical protein
MKTVKILLLSIVSMLLLSNVAKAQSKFDLWPELKTFHGVMSPTFHPSEEGNLSPIKERIGEMVTKAEALAQSKIPTQFENDAIKEAVNKLAVDSKKLQTLIKEKANDEQIKTALSNLHDTFHVIVEKCNKGDEKHSDH